MEANWNIDLVERDVTYALEIEGKVYLVEHVPARVDPETGEQFFSPETVEVLRAALSAGIRPDRIIETPVYEFESLRRTG